MNIRRLKLEIPDAVLITLGQCAEILGLKYGTARNLLYNDSSIGYIDYGRKKLWVLAEILEYKCNHYIEPKIA